ncbi:MAG: hypothetical protein IKT39_01230 [Clostridia bacterium]|nr:hypothetical protein [Clostridia bacterium]
MIMSLIITVVLVFGIPLAAVLFASDAGMAICILSFYLINPILSVGVGVFAGFDFRKRWFSSLYVGIIFMITVCFLLTADEPLFFLYSAIYTFFSFISMLVTSLILKRKK